jgi:hypothetical protein
MIMKIDIETREIGFSGDFILTSYHKGEFYKMRFCNGHSLREAKRLFKIYVNHMLKKKIA